MPARLTALLLGILALAALRARHDALPPPWSELDLAGRLWQLSGQYAVLTGLLAAAAFLAVARGWRIGAIAAAALIAGLSLSGVTALALPAPNLAPFGAEWLGHHGLASALPLGALGWWLAFAPRPPSRGTLIRLMTWPFAFAALTLLRGLARQSTDPFLSPPFAASLPLFLAGALALSLALLYLSRLLPRPVLKP